MIKNFLNPKEHPNPIRDSKVMAILMSGGVASGRVCANHLFLSLFACHHLAEEFPYVFFRFSSHPLVELFLKKRVGENSSYGTHGISTHVQIVSVFLLLLGFSSISFQHFLGLLCTLRHFFKLKKKLFGHFLANKKMLCLTHFQSNWSP